jgi:hypothetical protein
VDLCGPVGRGSVVKRSGSCAPVTFSRFSAFLRDRTSGDVGIYRERWADWTALPGHPLLRTAPLTTFIPTHSCTPPATLTLISPYYRAPERPTMSALAHSIPSNSPRPRTHSLPCLPTPPLSASALHAGLDHGVRLSLRLSTRTLSDASTITTSSGAGGRSCRRVRRKRASEDLREMFVQDAPPTGGVAVKN